MSAASRRARLGLALAGPTAVGTATFFVLPVIVLIWLTTQRWDLLSPPRWVGVEDLPGVVLDPQLWRALLVSAQIGLPALVAQLALGLLLGHALAARLPGMRVARVAALLPWLVAPFTAGLIARWVLAPSDGLLATLVGRRLDLLADPVVAPLAVAAVVAWQGTGFAAVVYSAAVDRLPGEVLEAAAIDGAGRWARFRLVEWPMLTRTTMFLGVTGVVQALGVYDVIVPLTGGGPGGATRTVSMMIVTTAWEAGEFGRAAAQSVLVALVAVAAVAGLRFALPRPA